MSFGFLKPSDKNKNFIVKALIIFLVCIVGLIFTIKSINYAQDLHTRNFSSLQNHLKQLSAGIGGLDKELGYAGFLLDKALSGGLDLLTHDEFFHIISIVKHPQVQKQLKERFPKYTTFLNELPQFSQDLYSLLGYNEEQTYLIILQNTNEARPNGGFFGSFALIKFQKGTISHLEIIDSYLPGFDRPNTFITGPEWFLDFLPKREIHFIGANKVGFTYHDGAHIKTLYEKSYPGQKIRGVIFLTTDIFTFLLDDFDEQIWEWQFANANINKIRGNDSWGKKEFYLKGSQEYFLENKEKILYGFLDHLPEILNNHWINMYLVDISGPFHGYIRRHNLTTRFEEYTAYLRESNISFNKIDNFVNKQLTCFDKNGIVLIEHINQDIFSLLSLDSGEYTCKITYTLAVPNSHIDFMRELEDEYEIEMDEREEHILALNPNRDSRVIFHIPPEYTIKQISGDSYETEIFQTPFSSAAMFKTLIEENNGQSNIFITFQVQ